MLQQLGNPEEIYDNPVNTFVAGFMGDANRVRGVLANRGATHGDVTVGAATLSLPQRATICNMGAELTLTTSVFPSDEATRSYFALLGREADWKPLAADADAEYDEQIDLDLSTIIARKRFG